MMEASSVIAHKKQQYDIIMLCFSFRELYVQSELDPFLVIFSLLLVLVRLTSSVGGRLCPSLLYYFLLFVLQLYMDDGEGRGKPWMVCLHGDSHSFAPSTRLHHHLLVRSLLPPITATNSSLEIFYYSCYSTVCSRHVHNAMNNPNAYFHHSGPWISVRCCLINYLCRNSPGASLTGNV